MTEDLTYEYELIGIEFEPQDELHEDVFLVREDDPAIHGDDKPAYEYDAEGVPMGRSKEETVIRRRIIFEYIQKWREEHKYNPCVYNEHLKDNIKVNQVIMLESVSHAAYSYLSTKAVLKMEFILTNASEEVPTRTKEGDSNQKPFEKMLVLRYKSGDLGSVKLTVGVRKRTHEKVGYSITVPDSAKPFINPELIIKPKGKNQKKRSK